MRLALACLVLAALAASAAASVIVVRSNHPAYPVGRTLPDNVRIPLGAGESVTVVGRDGSRVFRGPGAFSPASPVQPGARGGLRRRDSGRLGGISMSALERGRNGGPSVLVVRSSGPSAGQFARGASFPANSVVTLRRGDLLVMLGLQGTLTFRGPGRFTFPPPPPDFVRWRGGHSSQPLPTRVYRRPPNTPFVFDADIERGGILCVASNARAGLWRPGPAAAMATLTLTLSGPDARQHSLQWPAGEQGIEWPDDWPLEDGGVYELRRSDNAAPVRITVRIVRGSTVDIETLGAEMIAQGCDAQVDRLVAGTSLGDAIPIAAESVSPAPTLVDIGRDDSICLAPGARVVLRREDDEDMFLEIRDARGRGAIVDWVRGAGPLPWPANLPLADRARYDLGPSGGAATGHVVFRTLPRGATGEAGDDPVAVANALIARGCQSQLDRLIDASLAEETGPAG